MQKSQPAQQSQQKNARILSLLAALLMVSVVSFSLAGCGKKGPLYLPDDPAHTPKKPQKL